MQKREIIFLALAVAGITACQVKEQPVQEAAEVSTPAKGAYVQGQVLVQFDESTASIIEQGLATGETIPTKASGFADVAEALGIESLERVFPDAGPFEERTRREGLHRFYRVRFAESTPLTKAVETVVGLPGVESVTPSRNLSLRKFNDPQLSRQWHYINSSYSNADINVQGVWDEYTTGSDNVIVCVVDEPVDQTHPDLKDNLWKDASGHGGYNFAKGSYSLAIDPGTSRNPGDTGHGTHVGGTIAARNNNGVGLAGIAGGDYKNGVPGVKLMSCAIYSGTAEGHDDDAADAIKWGADHGAVISQNSWGPSADLNGDGRISSSELREFRNYTMDDDPTLKAAVDYFIKYAGCDNAGNQLPDSPMKGGLVFFAAGNEGDYNVDWDPYASYEPIVGVGASGLDGSRAYYSSYGAWVDIAAPGGDGDSSSDSIWSTLPTSIASSGYGGDGWAGTSMACPHASGVAALIVSYYGGQGFTADKAKEILFAGLGGTIGGSKPIGKKLDALESFKYGGKVEKTPLSIGATERTVHAHETLEIKVVVNVSSSDAKVTCVPGSAALSFNATTNTVKISGTGAPAGTYKAKFTLSRSGAEDYTVELTYTLLPNHAPRALRTIQPVMLSSLGVTDYVQVTSALSSLFTDQDGEALEVSWKNTRDDVAKVSLLSDRFAIKSLSYGISTVTITATDGLGEKAEITFNIVVKDPDLTGINEIYPAQATSELFFWPATVYDESYTISIYSETGRLVLQFNCEGSITEVIRINTQPLSPGVYTLVSVSMAGEKQTTTFIKY